MCHICIADTHDPWPLSCGLRFLTLGTCSGKPWARGMDVRDVGVLTLPLTSQACQAWWGGRFHHGSDGIFPVGWRFLRDPPEKFRKDRNWELTNMYLSYSLLQGVEQRPPLIVRLSVGRFPSLTASSLTSNHHVETPSEEAVMDAASDDEAKSVLYLSLGPAWKVRKGEVDIYSLIFVAELPVYYSYIYIIYI